MGIAHVGYAAYQFFITNSISKSEVTKMKYRVHFNFGRKRNSFYLSDIISFSEIKK